MGQDILSVVLAVRSLQVQLSDRNVACDMAKRNWRILSSLRCFRFKLWLRATCVRRKGILRGFFLIEMEVCCARSNDDSESNLDRRFFFTLTKGFPMTRKSFVDYKLCICQAVLVSSQLCCQLEVKTTSECRELGRCVERLPVYCLYCPWQNAVISAWST